MSNALNHFVKWKNFAEQRQWLVLPPEEDDPIFDARFDMFVIDQYNKHKNRTLKKSGKKRPNKPEAFKAVFSGINNIASSLFDSRRIQTPLLKKAKKSYSRLYPGSTIKKKAAPLEFYHVQNLANLASVNQEPFVHLVVNVIIMAWFAAGRWACINNIDIAKTISDDGTGMLGPNPDPSGKFSYLYYNGRKHRPGTSCSVLPTMDDLAIDPRQCFLRVIDTFDRKQSEKLIPACNKKRGVWIVDPDPNKSCPYGQFLKMFRDVMKLAGNDICVSHCDDTTTSDKWTLHCGRRGFVRTARNAADGADPLHWEIVMRHGGWKPSSMDCAFDYNDVDPATHAASLHKMFSQNMGRPTPIVVPTPTPTPMPEGQRCTVIYNGITLRGVLLDRLPSSTQYARVRIGDDFFATVPMSTVTLE